MLPWTSNIYKRREIFCTKKISSRLCEDLHWVRRITRSNHSFVSYRMNVSGEIATSVPIANYFASLYDRNQGHFRLFLFLIRLTINELFPKWRTNGTHCVDHMWSKTWQILCLIGKKKSKSKYSTTLFLRQNWYKIIHFRFAAL